MSYLNVDESESAIKNLALKYTNLCNLVELPNQTFESRICHVLHIGKASSNKNTILITGGVHAREWGSTEICIYIAADILEAYVNKTGLRYGNKYFNAEQIRSILENFNLLIFPCVNPDGRNYSQVAEPLWRRNRNRSQSHDNPSCIGVDLNRNYDFLWDFPHYFSPSATIGTSTDPCSPSQSYRGPSPFSESETKNVLWLFDNYPSIRWFVDLHSYGENILYNWGDCQNQSDDPNANFMNPLYNSKRGLTGTGAYKEYIPKEDLDYEIFLANSFRDGIEAVRGKKYTVEQAVGLYSTSGAADDYAYSRHFSNLSKEKIYAFTIEWGSKTVSDQISFHPEWAEMEKIVIDISAGILELCLSIVHNQSNVSELQLMNSDTKNLKEEEGFVEFLKKTFPSVYTYFNNG